mmetsp:Transcript_45712/g.78966  ORF Transcript_45712/g.78966 Transcript_45712/m.78966 type:complete len:499 (+) Transcript_45712:116-1612(+)
MLSPPSSNVAAALDCTPYLSYQSITDGASFSSTLPSNDISTKLLKFSNSLPSSQISILALSCRISRSSFSRSRMLLGSAASWFLCAVRYTRLPSRPSSMGSARRLFPNRCSTSRLRALQKDAGSASSALRHSQASRRLGRLPKLSGRWLTWLSLMSRSSSAVRFPRPTGSARSSFSAAESVFRRGSAQSDSGSSVSMFLFRFRRTRPARSPTSAGSRASRFSCALSTRRRVSPGSPGGNCCRSLRPRSSSSRRRRLCVVSIAFSPRPKKMGMKWRTLSEQSKNSRFCKEVISPCKVSIMLWFRINVRRDCIFLMPSICFSLFELALNSWRCAREVKRSSISVRLFLLRSSWCSLVRVKKEYGKPSKSLLYNLRDRSSDNAASVSGTSARLLELRSRLRTWGAICLRSPGCNEPRPSPLRSHTPPREPESFSSRMACLPFFFLSFFWCFFAFSARLFILAASTKSTELSTCCCLALRFFLGFSLFWFCCNAFALSLLAL